MKQFQRWSARQRTFWLLALGLGWAVAASAEDSLKSIFNEDEYRRTGLDKLSPAEQAVLLQALHQRGLGKTEVPPPGKPEMPSPGKTETTSAEKPGMPVPERKGLWARIKDFGAEQLPLKNAKDEGEVTEVAAQMAEPFRGLSGGTLFHLEGGQVWQQRFHETYYIGKPIPNPKVVILRTRTGYRLKIPVVGADFDVAIKRIE